ncbi:Fe-S cluster assembly protein NifU [Blastopirellula sp. JC732]|uniref:Nitrogen fixation protein NifU n=1 Tax=Blastopirellula sediminis TaxID=2894196 RepID=A0A9X1SF72_9BACT|nr:Fe-S cluster assembly protein NifU [Blastopirellula sediminis]MCC9608398.1 Fe-S cluster assembly protein NifU [Blastopirellula sediminis]MCC9628825.1 Fe-S cluster assembly protein NifU [Blastopirellula sediminis]
MWEYSEKVKEHFFNPRNAAAVDSANAVGDVGSLSCGDALRLTLKVDPETEIILDAGFQTFGCGSAIASSSALTEIIKGKTLEEALQVSNQDIADYLDGLPPEKMHCSVMGREALEAAIANYRGEVWTDDHEEGDLVCKCFGIDSAMIEKTVTENKLQSVQDVINFTKAGGGCSSCHEKIEDILETLTSKRQKVVAEQVETTPEETPAPVTGTLTILQKIRRIERVIDSIRPQVQMDGGDIELVDFDGSTVFVNLTGACSNCQLASATLGGVQQRILEDLGEFIRVVPATKATANA